MKHSYLFQRRYHFGAPNQYHPSTVTMTMIHNHRTITSNPTPTPWPQFRKSLLPPKMNSSSRLNGLATFGSKIIGPKKTKPKRGVVSRHHLDFVAVDRTRMIASCGNSNKHTLFNNFDGMLRRIGMYFTIRIQQISSKIGIISRNHSQTNSVGSTT